MNINRAYMLNQPPVDHIYKPPGFTGIIAIVCVTLNEPGQGLKKVRVCLLVFLGYRAAMFMHALLLKAEVATAIYIEAVEKRCINRTPTACVKRGTKIASHFEDHLVILVYAINARGEFFPPLHLTLPTFAAKTAIATQ
jgi:hypothetical protein